MSEAAALMLCILGGKSGSADEIKAVLEAAGAAVDEDKVAAITTDMEGKDVNELLAAGMEKLKDVPMGGGGGGGGAAAGGAAGGAAAEEVEEEEVEEEEAAPAGGGLFGDDGGDGDY